MRLRRDRRAIPSAEAPRLRTAVIRTRILRVALGLGLAGASGVAVSLAHAADARVNPLLPTGRSGVVVLDLSASIGDFQRIAATFRRLARDDERVGLVIFSDAAYGLLPPGTPGRELEAFGRFFRPAQRGGNIVFPDNPWSSAFSAGTRIAAGLEAGLAALQRAKVKNGSILLMSDLDISQDASALGQVVAKLDREQVRLRVIPLSPLPEQRALFESIVGSDAFLDRGSDSAAVSAPGERSFKAAAPWLFLLVAAGLVALLALNERFLARLELRT